jgi:peptide/nickel transport system substrate-binding protein
LRFHLKEPYGPFVTNTLGQIPILPKHVWEDLVEKEGLQHPGEYANMEPLGSGPFKFNYWRRGEEIKLDAHKEYFKVPEIDAMIYRLYGHADGVYGAMEKGEMDMNAWRFEPLHVEKARQMSHVTVTETPDIGFYFLGLNNRKPPFDDKTFRKAMAHSVNYQMIVDALMFGYATPGGAGKVISPANQYWHNPDVAEYEFDLEKSREILREAGYGWDSKGKMHFPIK